MGGQGRGACGFQAGPLYLLLAGLQNVGVRYAYHAYFTGEDTEAESPSDLPTITLNQRLLERWDMVIK